MLGFSYTYYKNTETEELSQDELEYRNFIRQRDADYQTLMKERLSNTKFAKENQAFLKACSEAGVDATVRQASKYRNKRGKAYNFGRI